MNSLVASVVWDEARFGLPLDLERFMIVAVARLQHGRDGEQGPQHLQHQVRPGRARRRRPTATSPAIESVVGHEYFHNWTGNRITCRDWFQLSLKEGLTVFRDQEFSMDMVASASARASSASRTCASLRQVQFPEDAGPMAHPVRPDSYVEINNFYTSTVYEKGAEVVRMMQTLVGRDGFARGMTLYFERHDGQAVTCDDFAQAIADANPESELARLLPQFKRWYSQAGTPRVTARGRYDAPSRTYTLGLEQSLDRAGGRTSRSSSRWRSASSAATAGRCRCGWRTSPTARRATSRVLVLDEARSFFTFVDVDQPPVLSLLRGFSAPVDPRRRPRRRRPAGPAAPRRRPVQSLGGRASAWPCTACSRRCAAASRRCARRRLRRCDARACCATRRSTRPFKELVLTLPSEVYVAEQLAIVDPQRIHAAREAMRREPRARAARRLGVGVRDRTR